MVLPEPGVTGRLMPVPCNGDTGESCHSVKTPGNAPRSPVGLEEGRENPVVQGSCPWGGCWHRDFKEQRADFNSQGNL